MRWIADRTILILLAMFCLALVIVLWQQQRLHQRLIRSAANAEAQRFAATLETFRTLYSREVVATVRNKDITVTHDYDSDENRGHAIPLPATLSMQLGNELTRRLQGGSTRLYSAFPFPYPDRNGLRDQFAKDAWQALNDAPDEPYRQFVEEDGQLFLRYAIADRMRESCVDCHNSHADSPKTDWREGDVRGVLEVTLPLDVATGQVSANMRESLILLSGVGGIGLIGLAIAIGRLRRTSENLEDRVQQRTAELQQTALSLERQEAQSRIVIESSPAAMIVTNRNGEIVLLNQQAERLFGYDSGELVGQPIEVLVPTNIRDDHEALRDDYFEHPAPRAMGEGRLLHGVQKDATEIPVEIGLTPVETDDGPAVLVAIMDQRERMRTEARLARQAEQLSDAKDAADAANRAKSAFLANMSHEIRTPMNGVIGMCELLTATQLQPNQQDYLSMMRQSADALLRLINDILDFSKIEAGRLELESIPFSLRDCIGSTGRALAAKAAEKKLELACRIAPQIPDILRGDPGRLRQILINLVGNAVKFTETGEVVVDVDVEQMDDDQVRLRIAVRDTGIGIPQDRQRDIFEAFSQADTSTTRRFGGTGLGLAISSELVQLMHGQIHLESDEGRGTTFEFTAEFGVESDQQPRQPGDVSTLHGLPVLVVDDNATNRRILQEILLSWKLKPILADNGPDALKLVQERRDAGQSVPLVLLDCMMPDMDGFEFARRIRVDLGAIDCTIIMISSGIRPGDADRCQELGIARCMAKPVIQSELLDAIVTECNLGPSGTGHTEPLTTETDVTPRRVLIAEDGLINQRVASEFLEHRGHQVIVVSDGQQALEILERESFDLVLMDVQMPVLDGLSATAALRERERDSGQHLPVVAMTANAMKGDRERCMDAGMDDYVSKPIEPAELYRVVESIPANVLPASPAPIDNSPDDPDDSRLETSPVVELQMIDWQTARRNMPGGAEFAREMAGIMIREAPRLLEQIRSGFSVQDWAAVERAAHMLKSSCGTLAAGSLEQTAQQIESCAGTGQANEVKRLIDELARLTDALLAELRTFLAEGQSGAENQ